MTVHGFAWLRSRNGTTGGRVLGRRAAAVLAAAAVVGGGTWLTVPAASAASVACGGTCGSLFNQKFGSADVAAVSGGVAVIGQAVILSAAAPINTEDWAVSFEAKVSDFAAAGLINATLNDHYGNGPDSPVDDPVFEFEYIPGGISSGLCLGVGSGPGQSTPVTLQACGTSANTTWIVDTADASGGYTPLVNGSDMKYPAPYVLTANTVDGNLTTQALKSHPGAGAGAQRWQAIFGVLP